MRQRIPFVLFDRVPRNFPGTAVVTDDFEASRNAIRYLVGLGHERIAIVICRPDLPNVSERLERFRQAMQDNGLSVSEEYFRSVGYESEGGYQSCMELVRLPPPSEIFCCNNKMTSRPLCRCALASASLPSCIKASPMLPCASSALGFHSKAFCNCRIASSNFLSCIRAAPM